MPRNALEELESLRSELGALRKQHLGLFRVYDLGFRVAG